MGCGEVMMDINNLIFFLVSPASRLPTDVKSLVYTINRPGNFP
jgi:hypothetical protein